MKMKEIFNGFPGPLRKQVLIQFAAGAAFWFLSVVIQISTHDIRFSFSGVLLAGYLFFCGVRLYCCGRNGAYLCIKGSCVGIETVGRKKQIRSIQLMMDGITLKIPIRYRLKRIAIGDTVYVYLSEKTPVYQWESGYMICSYYAVTMEKDGGQV